MLQQVATSETVYSSPQQLDHQYIIYNQLLILQIFSKITVYRETVLPKFQNKFSHMGTISTQIKQISQDLDHPKTPQSNICIPFYHKLPFIFQNVSIDH